MALAEHRILRAVFHHHVLNSRHGRNERNLREEAAPAQREHPADQAALQMEAAFFEPDGLCVEQVPCGKPGCEHLPKHRSDRRTHHPPAEQEDENRVQDQIHHRARKRCRHGKFRAAIRADDRVHRLPEHVKRDADGNISEILPGMAERLIVHLSAKGREDRLLKDEIQRGQHKAAPDRKHNCVADAPVRLFRLLCAKGKAHERAAAIPDHHGDGKRHHGQREHHGVCRVAVRAKVACVGDKHLIHNVVKCRHQQRNDAWHSVFAHQRADGFRFKKRI